MRGIHLLDVAARYMSVWMVSNKGSGLLVIFRHRRVRSVFVPDDYLQVYEATPMGR